MKFFVFIFCKFVCLFFLSFLKYWRVGNLGVGIKFSCGICVVGKNVEVIDGWKLFR